MKIIKFAIVFIVSVALLTAAFVSIFSVTDIKSESKQETSSAIVENVNSQNEPADENQNVTSASESQEDASASESSSDIEEGSYETEKAELAQVNAGDLSLLDTTAVTWGPGVNFNIENQPSACVSLQEKYGNLGAVFINSDNRIYLTFDLGYESGYTSDILDVLKANNVKATFFVTGSYARNQEEIVKRIINEGHTVGNHSNTHPDMTTVSDSDAADEIMQVHNVLKDNYGYESYLFRFPAGTFSEKTLAVAAENGYHSVFWSFAYNDWDNNNQPDVDAALEKVTERLHPGAVYLLHPMKTNSIILNDFIVNARKAGYEIGIM